MGEWELSDNHANVEGYAGDISPKQAWDMLSHDENAVLVDVRTNAEWNYVGVTDLTSMAKQQINVSWQLFPDGTRNQNFAAELAANGVRPHHTVLFLCRSGQRSKHAAVAMTQEGYGQCYNLLDGFEGSPDGDGHRGRVAGWKVAGLPWRQG